MTAALLALAMLVVSPNTDLVDGQQVRVRGSGYEPGTTLELRQCEAPFRGPEDCFETNVRFPTTDQAGNFATRFPVRRVIRTFNDSRVDCAASEGACVLVAFPVGEPAAAEVVPLSFDPDVPAMAPLQAEFTVDLVNEVDPRTGDVRISGTVRCSRPAQAIVDVELSQRRDAGVLVAVNFTVGRCSPEVRAWSVVIDSGRHAFRPGDAFVESSVDVSTDNDATGVTVNTDVALVRR